MGGLYRALEVLPASALWSALAGFVLFLGVLFQEHHLQEKTALVESRVRMLSELHRQRHDIEERRMGYQHWSDPWERIRQQGFYQEQPSSRWIEFLGMLERSGGVVVTRMVFLKTHLFSEEVSMPAESVPMDWQVSTISLGMGLLHEGYLVLFLQGLRDEFNLRMLPHRCHLLPTKSVSRNGPESVLPLQLDCQIHWLHTSRGGSR